MVTLVKFAWAKVRIQQLCRIVWYCFFINHVLVQGWYIVSVITLLDYPITLEI